MKKWWICESYILNVPSACLIELGEIKTIAVKIKFHEHFIHHPLNLDQLLMVPDVLADGIDDLWPRNHAIIIGVEFQKCLLDLAHELIITSSQPSSQK